MNYKVEKMVKNLKKGAIMYVIIWIALTILFVAPLSCSMTDAASAHGRALFISSAFGIFCSRGIKF